MAPLDRRGLAAALFDHHVVTVPKKECRFVHHLIGRSFAGTKTTNAEAAVHWIAGPHLSTLEDPERLAFSKFMMSFAVATMGPGSSILCTRGSNEDMAGLMLIQQCKSAPKDSIMDLFRVIGAFWAAFRRGEFPDTFAKGDAENKARKKALSKGFDKRTNKFFKMLKQMHLENANSPHIYIAILATDPQHQRNGYGGKLMRAAVRVADDAGLPAYLETGDPNRKFYESFGFEVVKTYSMLDDTDADWPGLEMYHAMVRKAPGSVSS